jgi:hypothetical protein
MVRAVRFLALLACTTLALPHGWCCLLAVQKSGETATAAALPGSGCCHRSTPQPPAEPVDPPAPADHCPCAERNATPPDTKGSATDPAAAAVLPAATTAPVTTSRPAVAAAAVPPAPPRPLHVLHCVWLC